MSYRHMLNCSMFKCSSNMTYKLYWELLVHSSWIVYAHCTQLMGVLHTGIVRGFYRVLRCTVVRNKVSSRRLWLHVGSRISPLCAFSSSMTLWHMTLCIRPMTAILTSTLTSDYWYTCFTSTTHSVLVTSTSTTRLSLGWNCAWQHDARLLHFIVYYWRVW